MNTQISELPIDTILREILPRLSAKSLGRCQCVCKQWKSFVLSQEFIKLHKSRNDEELLLRDPFRATFHSIDCENPHYPRTTMNVPFNCNDALLLASLDGLVCVGFKNSRNLMLWNPLTGAYKYLSNSKYYGRDIVRSWDPIGLYKDSLDDCFKILHVNRKRSGSCRAYIYSQRLDTWKKIKFLENAQRFSKYNWSLVTFANGSLYFALQGSEGERLIVISFDVNSRKFKEIQCPSGAKKRPHFSGRLVVVKDCIHLCVSYRLNRDSYCQSELDLWRLNGEEGWTKVESISIKDHYARQLDNIWIPICIFRNGDWLVLGEGDGSFYKIDMKTKEVIQVNERSRSDRTSWIHFLGVVNTRNGVMYTETLVSPSAEFK